MYSTVAIVNNHCFVYLKFAKRVDIKLSLFTTCPRTHARAYTHTHTFCYYLLIMATLTCLFQKGVVVLFRGNIPLHLYLSSK